MLETVHSAASEANVYVVKINKSDEGLCKTACDHLPGAIQMLAIIAAKTL